MYAFHCVRDGNIIQKKKQNMSDKKTIKEFQECELDYGKGNIIQVYNRNREKEVVCSVVVCF